MTITPAPPPASKPRAVKAQPVSAPPASTPPIKPAASPSAPPAVEAPFNDAFKELDSQIGNVSTKTAETKQSEIPKSDPPKEKPKAATETDADTSKGELDYFDTGKDEEIEQPVAKEEKEVEEPKEEEKEEQQVEAEKPKKPKKLVDELRSAYEGTKAKVAELEAALAAAKSAKPAEDPEKKEIAERLSSATKRIEELEGELRFVNFEKTDEYKQRYEQPFLEAYQTARNKVSQLMVENEEGEKVQAKPELFDQLIRVHNDDQAAEMAEAMFGTKATIALYHRERVLELNGLRIKAIEDYRKNGSEREKQMRESSAKEQEHLMGVWRASNEEAKSKFPNLFAPVEGDAEGNRLLDEGYRMADLAFAGDKNMSKEQMVKLTSAIYNRAAACGRLAYHNRKLSSRIKQLEAELSEFRDSTPKDGVPSGEEAPASGDNWEKDLEARARGA